jgi:hypothetical protein
VVAEVKIVPFQALVIVGTKDVPFHTLAIGGTVILRVFVFIDPETLVALRTKGKSPIAVGVPVIEPVEVFKLSPVGKLPEKIE